MSAVSGKPVSTLLVRWRGGDQEALKVLMPLVYDDLRRIARHRLKAERPVTRYEAPSSFTKHIFGWWTSNPQSWKIERIFSP